MIGRYEIPLLPTQVKLSIPVINRIYKKMKLGIPMPGIKVCDHLICDGHHRYVASLLAKAELWRECTHKTSATIATRWEEVLFVADDWDVHRQQEIIRINQQDARYLQITLHELLKMLD